jgi:hypothetical protein
MTINEQINAMLYPCPSRTAYRWCRLWNGHPGKHQHSRTVQPYGYMGEPEGAREQTPSTTEAAAEPAPLCRNCGQPRSEHQPGPSAVLLCPVVFPLCSVYLPC